jgi:hypothetical protein
MAASAAAAAEEGMEPRALHYEQTLVSEVDPSPEGYAGHRCSRFPRKREGWRPTLAMPQPSKLGKLRLGSLRG